MKLLPLFCLFFCLGFSSFAQPRGRIVETKEAPEPPPPPAKVMNAHVVLPYDPANPGMRSIFPGKVRKAELSAGDIEQLDVLLKKCINDYNLSQELRFEKWQEMDSSTARAEFFINFATYQKQFVPVMTEANQKVVWVNAFCYVGGDQWLKDVIRVDDGGKCFFNVKINLTTKTIHNLVVNSM